MILSIDEKKYQRKRDPKVNPETPPRQRNPLRTNKRLTY